MVKNHEEFKGQDPEEWFYGVSEGKHPTWFNAHPLRRPPTEEDCAQSIIFLASEDSKNITGQIINVDSGYVSMVTN